jgi:hypothetical protein
MRGGSANWKKDLLDRRAERGWSRGLEDRDYWCLVNHVIDRITLPSCIVFVGCHEKDIDTPMCWAAVRRIPGLLAHEVVYLYARKSLWEEPELAASLERAVLSAIEALHPLVTERRPYNPFLELRRQ